MNCATCGKEVSRRGSKRFCSQSCYGKSKIGSHHTWGSKISAKLSGKKKSKEHVEKVRIALTGRKRPEITGSKNKLWKGDNASYGSIHDWVSRVLGRPKWCMNCVKVGDGFKYQWSNKSGLYKREVNDWQRFCVQCHRKFDMNVRRASLLFEKVNGALKQKKP